MRAQQVQQYAQYMVNPYVINPAVGGTEDFTDVKASYRAQWTGLEGAPRTIYFSGHGSLGREFNQYHRKNESNKWHGVGGYAFSDKAGAIERNAIYGSYAYNLPLRRKLRLSVGLFLGLKQFRVDTDMFEDLTNGSDPQLTGGVKSKVIPDLALGGWLYDERFFVGFSVFQLLHNKVNLEGATEDDGRLQPHYFLSGGLRIPINEDWNFVPSIIAKAVRPAPISVDYNLKIDYMDTYYAGVSYRSRDAFGLLVGTVLFRRVEVSYSYEFTVASVRHFNDGSHELIVGYRFGHPKCVKCPSRFW